MFEELDLKNKIDPEKEDITDLSKIINIISKEKPDFIFHLAAQPIVSKSYESIETILSNVVVLQHLQALKISNHKCL